MKKVAACLLAIAMAMTMSLVSFADGVIVSPEVAAILGLTVEAVQESTSEMAAADVATEATAAASSYIAQNGINVITLQPGVAYNGILKMFVSDVSGSDPNAIFYGPFDTPFSVSITETTDGVAEGYKRVIFLIKLSYPVISIPGVDQESFETKTGYGIFDPISGVSLDSDFNINKIDDFVIVGDNDKVKMTASHTGYGEDVLELLCPLDFQAVFMYCSFNKEQYKAALAIDAAPEAKTYKIEDFIMYDPQFFSLGSFN